MANNLSQSELRRLFRLFDNGNGILSLAEIQAAIKGYFPHLVRHKKAVMRAYKNADRNGNGFIDFREFSTLMSYLHHFNEISELFKQLDENGDHRISFAEFQKGHELLGLKLSNSVQMRDEFDRIDDNHSGYIVFDEFCAYMTERMGY